MKKSHFRGGKMLVNFRFENFLSADQMIEFSMTSGRVKQHKHHLINIGNNRNILKFSALYGANASGKSTFVKSISRAQKLIISGFKDNVLDIYSYNRNNDENKDRETKFEFEICIDKKIYCYGFSAVMSQRKFTQEWLYDITNESLPIYTIDKKTQEYVLNEKYLNFDESITNRLKIYVEDNIVDNQQLLLTALNLGKRETLSRLNVDIFYFIFNWFLNKLEVIGPNDIAKDSMFVISEEGDKFQNLLSNYLDGNDTGVVSLVKERVDTLIDVPASVQEDIIQRIKIDTRDSKNKKSMTVLKTSSRIFNIACHDENIEIYELKFKNFNGVHYSLFEESDGTIRLIELFAVLYNRIDKTFIIDEIDRSLHPLLTYNFIESFLNKNNKSQLIVTTHEDVLLNFELLRRDEIWFVRKDDFGNSLLYSLEEFKERFDKNILNAYLDGRYGAIPRLRNIFSDLMEES